MPTIRVIVRFRPINNRERTTAAEHGWSGKDICPIYVDEKHLLEFDGDVAEEDKVGSQVRCIQKNVNIAMQPKFAFDEILVWVNQQTAFQRIGLPVVNDALNGINGTIFAYGQTGSGKTFSMFGPEPLTENNSNLLGVIPRCCAQIFTSLSSDPKVKHYRIDVSFFEIYIHNAIRDLLHPAKKGDPPLKVRDGLKGVFIEHLKPETAENLQAILSLIALANSHRTVSSTKMNATSSRSHSVMRVSIRIERVDGSRCKSQINFGDLAGSEKVNKTGATGQTLREAQAINQSLTMLGNVISALAKIGSGKKKQGSMVPFRDSALTHVLKDSLSGNCKTTLVTAASPHKFNVLETISTFRFGSRCKLVKTKAEKNVVLSPSQMRKMIESLKTDIKSLKMQLLKGGGGGIGNTLSGIGVKISWPNDFQPWSTEKRSYDVLKKQVNQQIKSVLQTSVANNSDDVDNMPYSVSLSEPGTARKVIIQFHADDNDYNRTMCIELSRKLAAEIDKINKNSLEPALRNYKLCKMFSEPSAGELKQVIDSQKLQITLLTEQCDNATQEISYKNKVISDLEQNIDIFDKDSISNGGSNGGSNRGHIGQYTTMSGGGSMVKLPDLFSRKSNLRASSIFDGSVGSNSLRTTDLLSQLLHSKYEVLRSKRSLQLLQVRYTSEQKKMAQLRYIISRMQSEFMDLKATSLVSKAVISNVAGNIYDESQESNIGKRTLSFSRQISVHSRKSFLNQEDNQFLQGALEDILNDMDNDDNNNKNNNKQNATPALIRRLSTLSGAVIDDNNNNQNVKTPQPRSGRQRGSSRSGRQRRASAGHLKQKSFGTKSALNAYNFNKKKKNNLPNQIFADNGKAKQFGKASASYLARESVRASKSKRKELLNDMITSHSSTKLAGLQHIDDDDDKYDDIKKRQNSTDDYIPNVPFNDADKLWTGYDKEWIKKWNIDDVTNWLKKIYDGRMRKYTKEFRKKKIDGKRLLDLQMPELRDLRLTRGEALNILAFTNSIAQTFGDDDEDFHGFFDDLDDFDKFFDDFDDDMDDFFDDMTMETDKNHQYDQENDDYYDEYGGGDGDATNSDEFKKNNIIHNNNDSYIDRRFYDDPTQRLTDLMIEQLNNTELREIQKLPLFQTKTQELTTNFRRIKEYYHYNDYSQVLLATIYGLLCNKIGLLNICEWNDLLKLAKSKTDSDIDRMCKNGNISSYFDDHMVIINSFVDVYSIYSKYSDHETGKLRSIGGRYFVASLRQTAEEANDLRDDEDGVEFFCGLRIDEMEKFVLRLPNTIWILINNPLEIEFVYREIRKKCSANITPQRLQEVISEIGAEFVAPDMVKQSIKEMNLTPNPTITLDVWIKKLFIKTQNDSSTHASESVLNELISLNDELEMIYYKQQRLELLARDSIGSQQDIIDDNDDNKLNTLNIDNNNNNTNNTDKILIDHGSHNRSQEYFDNFDSDEDYNHNEEKEVSWIDNYLNLNKLLHDVGKFGTSGKCSNGFMKIPNNHFIASSGKPKKCKLNSKYGWSADIDKDNINKDNIHWIQVDLGKITTLFAIAIQGKYNKNEYITKGVLTASNRYNNDGNDDWKKIQLAGNSNGKLMCSDNNTVQVYMFARWIKARFVRLNIYEYNIAPSIRWDLLFGDVKIDNITSL